MNVLIPKVGQVNGAYATRICGDFVCGRGLKHRVFDSYYDRLDEAADVVTGVRRYLPTLTETAGRYVVSVSDLRGHIKARAEREWDTATTNDAVVVGTTEETTDETSVEPPISATATPDTPEVRVSLRRFAASLGCQIKLLDEEPRVGRDYGTYALVCGDDYHLVLQCGLPIEGIADALECLAHERRLPDDRMEEAWANFGKTWWRP